MKNYNKHRSGAFGVQLKEILSPLGFDEFISSYWSKKSFYQPGNGAKFKDLLTLDSFDRTLTTTTHDTIRIVKDHNVLPSNIYSQGHDKEMMIKLFNEGYSIIYESLNKTHEPLRNLCWDVKSCIKIARKVYANVYLTPAFSHAFKRHIDPQDVLVLQISGRKIWKVFETIYKYPINHEQTQKSETNLDSANQIDQYELQAGDVLYIPRGMPHEVYTTSEDSLHITLTIETFTNYDIMILALNRFVEEDELLRADIPFNFFLNSKDIIKNIIDNIINKKGFENDWNKILQDGETDFNSNLRGYFVDRISQNIKTNTRFVLRKNIKVKFVKKTNFHIISTRFRTVRIDQAVEEIEFIRSGNIFQLSSLPGNLDKESKVDLINNLILLSVVEQL